MNIKSKQSPVEISVTVERKQAALPRYVVVPDAAVAAWRLGGTTAVEVCINGATAARRTIKRWDAERWFVSVTEEDCRRFRIDTGDEIRLSLITAPPGLPAELAELLRAEPAAQAAWARLTPGQQRMLGEEVAAAKRPETRARRARKALLGE